MGLREMLFRPTAQEREMAVKVTWERVVGLISGLMEPQGLYPERSGTGSGRS